MMALFDMFALRLNDTNHIEPIKVKKTDREGSKRAAKGMVFIGRISANTSSKAIAIAETRLKSRVFNICKKGEQPEKKMVIFCDINGVLDNYEGWQNLLSHKSEKELTDIARLQIVVCADKLEKLVRLAVKYNAEIVTTSDYRKVGITIYDLIRSCLGMNGTDEQRDLVRHSKSDLFLRTGDCTPYDKYITSRSDEILEYVHDQNVTHCIVLEDSHPIPDRLYPVLTNENNGLGESHFEKIEHILAGFD